MPTSISLVMCVYNRQRYLAQAIDSILAQTYPHWNLVIWDDGSTDESPEIARQYADKDPRIQFISAPHAGFSHALVGAIAAVPNHPYLASIDSDDFLAKDALALTVDILDRNADVGMVYSDCLIMDEHNQLKGLDRRCQIPYSKDRLLIDFMTFHFRLLRREVYDRVGGIDRDFESAQDYDLCLKLSEVTNIYHLQQPLYYYRVHSNSMSVAGRKRQIKYAGKAVTNALHRRGLSDRYRLNITPTGRFHLQKLPDKTVTSISQTIPKIIHQTWKDKNLPPYLAALQRTWQEHHPEWEFKLWTDADNRDFLAEHYPWFLPIYDGYDRSICRVDAVRYFWLYHYGGVYVDLDFECLSSIDPLLTGRSLVLSLEPQAHTIENHKAKTQNFSEILSPAWMASVAGHPFWKHIWQHLTANREQKDPLDATGPFLLTRAYQTYSQATDITLIPASKLQPITLAESDRGELFSLEFREKISREAKAIHHWLGSWWKKNTVSESESLRSDVVVSVFEKDRIITQGKFSNLSYQPLESTVDAPPLISCLMVTKNRANLAKRAIFCFLQQTYSSKELIIVDDSDSNELEEFIGQFPHPQIVYERSPSPALTLGELRNISIAKATGTYIANWDDDDLCDPLRLELQMAVIQSFKIDGCLLDALYVWFPHQQLLAKSFRRAWEGTLLCRKDIFPSYPSLQRGEDTEVVTQLIQNYRIAALDRPELYLYGIHQNNTWSSEHFDRHWQTAQVRFKDDAYVNKIQEFALRLPIHSYLQSLNSIEVKSNDGDRQAIELTREELPLISCLMVTKNRANLAKISISCFLNQTYPNKELVIVDDGESSELQEFVRQLNHPQISHYHLPSQGLTLGELRNISVAKATGSYLSQWDDDDLSDPSRLESQMTAIRSLKADGCFLDTLYMWWPDRQRLIESRRRIWEGTLVCRKDIFPVYPSLRRGEDTEVVQLLLENHRIAAINRPHLYLYGIHQNNTWNAEHFDAHWQVARTKFEDDAYLKILQKLALRLPIHSYLQSLQSNSVEINTSEAIDVDASKSIARSIELELDTQSSASKIGINVSGFLNEGFGINEGVSYCLKALEANRIPHVFNQFKGANIPVNPHRINLIHANPDMLLDPQQQILSSLGDRYFQGKYNIGYWVWESRECFPQQWLKVFKLFQEIWTPSHYSQQAIASISPIPVVTIPHSISLPETSSFSRQDLGWKENKFIFLFIYDPLSLTVRKNPEGVITAFKKAFDRSDDRVSLVIKTKGLSSQSLEKFKKLTDDRPQIEIINDNYDRDRLNALLYHCNCYISLHRSEGFGLTLAEAMFYGKPTITTGFSGNLDFTNNFNSFLVDYRSIQLGEQVVYFGKETVWAQPNLDRARDYMRLVVENPDLGRKIGAKAAKDIRSLFSPKAIASTIQRRLQAIEANIVSC
jgi:glycosyltransferase involved in cell wall biosynthesis